MSSVPSGIARRTNPILDARHVSTDGLPRLCSRGFPPHSRRGPFHPRNQRSAGDHAAERHDHNGEGGRTNPHPINRQHSHRGIAAIRPLMKPLPVLLLYSVDERTLPVDAETTFHMIERAEEALRSVGWEVASSRVTDELEAALAAFPPDEWLVFNLCEGSPLQPFYYARVARELEQRGYAFTGSGSAALDETQSKPAMKRILEADGLATPRWQAFESADDLSFDIFPAIVKPATEHCSFGVTRNSVVFTLEEARAQSAAILRQYDGGAIIEEFLDSDEYGISLWGEKDNLEVLGISVIRYD